ncbi:MAG: sulfatase-like hydrolase/transferase, partial [Pirellulales bacterium]
MKHVIACLIMLLCCSRSVLAKPPNILIFLADDLGWADLGFQGSSDIRTPNIDRLAANSIRFSDGHVTASVCSP